MRKLFFLVSLLLFMTTQSMAQNEQTGIISDIKGTNGVRIVKYVPQNVCAKLIYIEIEQDGVIKAVEFTKGCDGNAKGVGALIKGMQVKDAIARLEGILCGKKETSCPDQLAKALIEIQRQK